MRYLLDMYGMDGCVCVRKYSGSFELVVFQDVDGWNEDVVPLIYLLCSCR